MESPPKTFGSPLRKKHKSNRHEHPAFSSPPRRRHSELGHHGSPIRGSPIATRYHTRVTPKRGDTALYDPHNDALSSPVRAAVHRSPISPTFRQLHSSPSRQRRRVQRTASCDRYTPSHGPLDRYGLHSPTKRFVHGHGSYGSARTIRMSAPSQRKVQNLSSSNDDPSSLNHRLKQRLSAHTYNQVLQSELLGFSAEHSNIANQVFGADEQVLADEAASNLQIDEAQTIDVEDGEGPFSIFSSPRLPTRHQSRIRSTTKTKNDSASEKHSTMAPPTTHHPLCPCHRADDALQPQQQTSLDSSESEQTSMETDFEARCVCDSITSNVATNFLVSPQRTLRYRDENTENENNENYNGENDIEGTYTMTPIKKCSQSALSGSRKSMRNIAKSPFKVLDAPKLLDDFYLNLVGWGASSNVLSVGLGECVYLWSAYTSKVTKLCDLTELFEQEGLCDFDSNGADLVCSVGWSHNHQSALRGCQSDICDTAMLKQPGTSTADLLAVGSGSGHVFVFDSAKAQLVRKPLSRHSHRVGVIAWRDANVLASGSRDRSILMRDIRMPDDVTHRLGFHKQEVCGLKWSADSLYLASGGNDNKLAIWDVRASDRPLCYGKHKAAVKAITWSPHESGLIASGGGTADRCIKFWNINSFIAGSKKVCFAGGSQSVLLKPQSVMDTGSQVCNLLWSKNVNEIVSTHGYSLNQIVVWKYPTMDKIVTLTGHTYRVLYLAGSPDGQTVVTGAGDETLRLWNVFPPVNQDGGRAGFVPKPYSIPISIR